MLIAWNNRAMARLKLEDWQGVLDDTAHVIQKEPNNVKALLRHATARYEMQCMQHNCIQITLQLYVNGDVRSSNSSLHHTELLHHHSHA